MSATLRSDRVLLYAPTSDDDGSVALVDSGAPDAAWWMAYAVTGAADQPVALRQIALRRAVFTASDRLPITDASVLRPLRDGILYRAAGLQPVPRARELLVAALSTGGAAVKITQDAPRYTVASVSVAPEVITSPTGARIVFTTVVRSALGEILNDRTATWKSSDNAVCLVTASTGVGECYAPGTVTVTATVDGVDGTATVTVT